MRDLVGVRGAIYQKTLLLLNVKEFLTCFNKCNIIRAINTSSIRIMNITPSGVARMKYIIIRNIHFTSSMGIEDGTPHVSILRGTLCFIHTYNQNSVIKTTDILRRKYLILLFMGRLLGIKFSYFSQYTHAPDEQLIRTRSADWRVLVNRSFLIHTC